MKYFVSILLMTLIVVNVEVQGYTLSNFVDNSLNKVFSLVPNENQEFSLNARNNPDVTSTTLEMIKRAGYPAEAHSVITEDGYILSVHRIPGKPGSSPIFLQHGLLGSSADWVMSGKFKGLAYLLADKGYDVWLGNARGNTYSRAHKTLTVEDSKFWDFSFHEMGIYDVPAVLEHITECNNESLIYIGHSMGTIMFWVMASLRPESASKVTAMIALAPVAYVGHVKTPFRLLAPFSNDIELISELLGADEFLPQNIIVKYLARYGCDLVTVEEKICENVLFVITGFDKDQFNSTLMPVILGHTPAGASTKTLTHIGQEVNSGRFQAFDYGKSKNLKYYNSTTPPDYDLSKVNVPVALMVADNDWLAAPADVNLLWKQLPNRIEKYRVPLPEFNHIDFLWAINAPTLVYEQIFDIIERYLSNDEDSED